MAKSSTHKATAVAPSYRVKFVIDDDARFEESNGESRPMTAEEYAGNEYRACPIHPRGHKVAGLTNKSENGRAWCGLCGAEYANVPYTEYLAYYGNPEAHVYMGAVLEQQCTCCGKWSTAGSLWYIDVMDDDHALQLITLDKPMAIEKATGLPGYLGEVARELLSEAQHGD